MIPSTLAAEVSGALRDFLSTEFGAVRCTEFIAPFTRCDRELDYRIAREAFDSRIAVM